jgi:hypothetical protein
MEFQEIILSQTPRLLGLLDRNSGSNTYGCFDRTYWHYREKDTPNAEFQEAVLALALLHENDFPGNAYYKNENILNWLLSAVNFWTAIQNKDGSFNESYANEYSFVATAFSTYAISEALLQLNRFPLHVVRSLENAGQWMMKNSDPARLPNHEAGAVAALHNIFKITGKKEYEKSARKILAGIRQSSEGWFNEYGGADIGYQSLTIDYLAKYYASSKNKYALKLLEHAVGFISCFVHPDGTAGGEYGSRSTEWIFPHGFKLVSKKISLAGRIFDKWLVALASGRVLAPHIMDDRYFIEMLNNFVQTYLELPLAFKQKQVKLPHETAFKNFFPEAMLFVVSNKDYYAVASGKGTLHVFSKTSPIVFGDCGFIGKVGNRIFTSNLFGKNREMQVSENQISISGSLYEYKQLFFSPLAFALFKFFTSTFAKSKAVSLYLKRKIIEEAITKRKTVPIKFQRKITFGKQITVEDMLESRRPVRFDSLFLGGRFSLPYVTFSKYFLLENLGMHALDLTRKFNSAGKVKIRRTINTRK